MALFMAADASFEAPCSGRSEEMTSVLPPPPPLPLAVPPLLPPQAASARLATATSATERQTGVLLIMQLSPSGVPRISEGPALIPPVARQPSVKASLIAPLARHSYSPC